MNLIHKLSKAIKIFILRDKFLLSARQWFKDKGDDTLRLNYNLTEESIVFDVGGYKGGFTEKIYTRYKSNIYIFEPVNNFYNQVDSKFSNFLKIHTYNFGLSNKNQELEIALSEDASSIHIKSGKTEKIKLCSIIEFLDQNNIQNINLIKINIEGGEFDLLPALIDSEIINSIDNLQIQFHTFIENAEKKREEIRKKLSKTHELTYDYYFIWENWKLKK